MENQIKRAIETSIREVRTVQLQHSADLETDLLVECEDSVETHGGIDVWGTTEDGDEWRVYLAFHGG